MKKIGLISILCLAHLLMNSVANCDQAVLTNEIFPVDVEKETSSEKSLFHGFYIGGGLGFNFTQYSSYRLGSGGANVPPLGVGYVIRYDEQKVKRPMFSFLFGYGDTFVGKFYVGLEGLVDVSKSKTESVKIHGEEIIDVAHDSDGGYVKHHGISAELGLRLGYVFNKLETMVYLRPAVAFLNETRLYHDSRRNFTGPDGKLDGQPRKATFSIAVGAEKIFCNDFSARLEIGHLFQRSFTGTSFSAHNNIDTGWRTKAKTEAWNVRLLFAYNFR